MQYGDGEMKQQKDEMHPQEAKFPLKCLHLYDTLVH